MFRKISTAVLFSAAMLLVGCTPSRDLPEGSVFPKSVTDSYGNTINSGGGGLASIPPGDWNLLQGSYGGSIYFYWDQQDYTFVLSSRNFQGGSYPYVEFRSGGENSPLGKVNFASYMPIQPYPYVLTAGVQHYLLVSSVLPEEFTPEWVNSPVSLGLLLGVRTQPNGSKQFDPTQSNIYIMDCAFSVGLDNCSEQYEPSVAGFLDNFGKR